MRLLVIGEKIIDRFVYIDVNRLNPEAPSAIGEVVREEESLGGAYNSFNNIQAINKNVDIICNKTTPIKTRFIDKKYNYILLRTDFEDKIKDEEKIYFKNIEKDIKKYQAIVFSDYNKGLIDNEEIQKIARFCKEHAVLTFIDTKRELGIWSDDIDFIKLNEHEYEKNIRNLERIKNHIIISLGQKGCMYLNKQILIEQEKKIELGSVVGAGDSFWAAFVVDYLLNKDILKAMKVANRAGAAAVCHQGIYIIKPSDIWDL